MITLHFHLQTQYKYDLFHIHFTLFHYTGKYELTKLTSLPMCGFIAQLVEHRTGIRGGHGFESHWNPEFFRLLLSNCLNLKIYCDDHSSLSSTTAVQIWIILYTLHISFVFRWSKRRPKRRVPTWDRADEAAGCTPEYCIPGWLLHFAGAQVPGDRVCSVWWSVAVVTTQEAIGKAFPIEIFE